jgi:hypothetical protein
MLLSDAELRERVDLHRTILLVQNLKLAPLSITSIDHARYDWYRRHLAAPAYPTWPWDPTG